MTGTLRVLRAEGARLAAIPSTYIVAFILFGVAALRAFVAVGLEQAQRGEGAEALSSGSAWAAWVDGWSAGLVLGTLMLLVFAARSLAGDAENGVLRLAITRSATRGALVWGRLLLAPLLVVAVVSVTGIAAWAVAAAMADFGPLVEDGYEIYSAAELAEEVRRSALAVLPGLLATFAFGLFVSSVARSATVAVTTALGLFLTFDLFKEALGAGHYWVFASHVPTPWDTSAWSELPGVVRGYSDAGFPEALVRVGWIGPWPALLLCCLAGCYALSRRAL